MRDHDDLQALSASQMQIWIGQQKEPASPLYNMAYCYHINGNVQPAKFVRAWLQLADSTSCLKTRIIEQGESIAQHFNGNIPEPDLIDLSTEKLPAAQADDWMQEQTGKPFDLSGPLLKSALLKVSDSNWIWYCNQHHLITDAWSFQLLWDRLANTYFDSAYSTARTDVQKISQYRSFLEHEKLQRINVSAQAREHWTDRRNSSPLNLYGRETHKDITNAYRFDHLLTTGQSEAIQKLCALPAARSFSLQLSRFYVLLAAYAIMLHKISNHDTLTLYTPLLNRNNPALRETPGLVSEVVPIQISLQSSDCGETVINKVRREMTNCLKQAYNGVASQVTQQNCTAIFNYITNATSNFGDFPATAQWLHSGHSDSHHVMRLHFNEYHQHTTPSLLFEFNQGSFSESRCKTAIRHWWNVVDAIAADTQAPIGLIALDNQHSRALTIDSTPPATDIVTLFDATRSRFPHAIAIADADSSITYEELTHLSHSIAAQLSDAGVCSGDRVMVVSHRTINLPAIFIAILMTGATYVPVDPLTPASRIETITRQCDPALLLVSHTMSNKIPTNIKSTVLDDLIAKAKNHTDLPPHRHIAQDPAGLAYIMFTSGSTGEPKGVMISHAALANYIQWAARFYSADKQLAFPFYTSIGFDLTVTSIYVPLITGGHILVYPESESPVDLVLLDVLKDNKADIIKLTPAHLALLQGQDLSHSNVTQLIVGGEDLKTSIANKIQQAFPGNISIHNEYGPTEAAVGCVVHTFEPHSDTLASVPIGIPVAGTQVRIVNEYGIDQPSGVAGELLIAGPSLAQGYWNNPDETEKRFIKAIKSTAVSYKSGDIVRMLDNGQLIYIGRRDNQVKVNGHRIELAEIEAACLKIPGITDCVANYSEAANLTSHDQQNMPARHCIRCGLSSDYPSASYNRDGICHLCQRFEKYKSRASEYFRPENELRDLIVKVKAQQSQQSQQSQQYDCIALLSGGKDSSYMLGRLVDMGLRVLAYTLDNGFISDGAKQNAQRVCKALEVDHIYGRTNSMNDIFKDSLERHSNVCHGCFKTIYTLSLKEAHDRNISTIFTGLSRGQFFETRLTEELFTKPEFKVSEIDEVVLDARKTYHQIDDAVKQSLDTTHINNSDLLERVQFIDFYRYCDVNLDELLDYLSVRLPWVRPSDTGRSTNCLINDVGIYVHKLERGYHNYALPYSWDVRLGHKDRDDAMEELQDNIDEKHVTKILDQIGYQPKPVERNRPASISVYYTSTIDIGADKVRNSLSKALPPAFRPAYVIPLKKLPLNKNGKIDKTALPAAHNTYEPDNQVINRPETALELELEKHWCRLLNRSQIDITSNFFALGGDSLMAIKLISAINASGFSYTIPDLFKCPTISELARLQREKEINTPEAGRSKPFSQLSSAQLARLSNKLS